MDERQVIWLQSSATQFAAICDLCIADADDEPSPLRYWQAKVTGSLRLDADVGFSRCQRGHRLCVTRVARALAPPTAAARR